MEVFIKGLSFIQDVQVFAVECGMRLVARVHRLCKSLAAACYLIILIAWWQAVSHLHAVFPPSPITPQDTTMAEIVHVSNASHHTLSFDLYEIVSTVILEGLRAARSRRST